MNRFIFCTLACLGIAPNMAESAPALPAEVQADINAAKTDCKDKAVFTNGFLVKKDVNGDGVVDFILNYGSFRCGGASLYCGSAGCTTTVYASLPGGRYAKVLDDNLRGLRFATIRSRPAMLLELHGSACGKVGAEACHSTLVWNGRSFVKAR